MTSCQFCIWFLLDDDWWLVWVGVVTTETDEHQVAFEYDPVDPTADRRSDEELDEELAEIEGVAQLAVQGPGQELSTT
jgi:hypothetical protein